MFFKRHYISLTVLISLLLLLGIVYISFGSREKYGIPVGEQGDVQNDAWDSAIGALPSNVVPTETLLAQREERQRIPSRGTIVLNDDNFLVIQEHIYEDPSRFIGRTIEMSGRALEDTGPGFSLENRILVGRDIVWCCENDMVFTGFLVLLPEGQPLPEEGSGVIVTGKIEEAFWTAPGKKSQIRVPAIRASSCFPFEGFSSRLFPY